MATVVGIGLGAVVCAAAVVGVLLGGAVAARHRAGTAADFAAIAAAQRWADGRSVACRAAARVAADDGAQVDSCRVSGAIAEVRVSVPVPGPLGRLGPARATARAGPAVPGLVPDLPEPKAESRR
jgi:secretion/DNA translocation related TadE-like protein